MAPQILCFDQPRSGSHMLLRMLTEKQSNVTVLQQPYAACRASQISWLSSESYLDGMSSGDREAFDVAVDAGTRQWHEALRKTHDQDSILFVHSHLFTPVAPLTMLDYLEHMSACKPDHPGSENFTMLPDDIILRPGSIPVFTIREPRLAVPSALRTMAKMGLKSGAGRPHFLSVTNMIWTRTFYDYYVAHGIEPVVVDFESLVDPAFVSALCERLGLDAASAHTSWEPATETEIEGIHPMYYASQSSLIISSGFDKSKMTRNVNLQALNDHLKEEFADDADLVIEAIELTMPHYQYMFERRMKSP